MQSQMDRIIFNVLLGGLSFMGNRFGLDLDQQMQNDITTGLFVLGNSAFRYFKKGK